jgi:hypothetical protein
MGYFTQQEVEEFEGIFALALTPQSIAENISVNGSRTIESLLADSINYMTNDQIAAVFDSKWDYMFQDGRAHYDWNTDRRAFTNALIKFSKKLYTTTSHETWYDVYTTWYNYCGLFFKVVEEVPRTLSGGRCQMHTTIVEESEIPAKPTHCIAALRIRKGELHIVKQFTGTLEDCEKMQDKLIQEYGSDVYIRTFEVKDED